MPFSSTKRFGAVADIPSDHGSVVSLTADAAGDVVGASAVAVGGAGGHSGGTSRFDALAPPQLVADGEVDVVLPTTNSRALAESLPSARLVVYPDSAQGFLFQYPDAFAKDVAAFLRRP